MKLSEASIKGCEGTRQSYKKFKGSGNRYCYFGAALRGIGWNDYSIKMTDVPELNRTFPIMMARAKNPVTNINEYVGDICLDLNDKHKWPRLSIAEWLANVVEPEFENETR